MADMAVPDTVALGVDIMARDRAGIVAVIVEIPVPSLVAF